jgi:hypothetical protein
MCLRVSYKKKYEKNNNFFCKERSRIRIRTYSLVRGLDPQIQIRTKMSGIPNTGRNQKEDERGPLRS